jgi:hypothetical protein
MKEDVMNTHPYLRAWLAGYYLLWKYVVDFVNRVLGIA